MLIATSSVYSLFVKHCFFFLLDGARFDVFKNLVDQGKLPNISKYFLKTGELKKILTTFPSTTGPAYLPFLTGESPGICNIPGIRWFDKNFSKHRSYVGIGSRFINADLAPNIKTLFHLIPHSFNIFNPISAGLSSVRNKVQGLGALLATYGHFTSRWQLLEKRIKESFIKILKFKPQFVFCVFPSIDGISHVESPTSPRVIEAYSRIDQYIGEILEKHIQRNDPHFENTLVIISSDHGLSETHSHFDVSHFLNQKGTKVLSYPLVWRKKYELAVMPGGNAMAHLYFTDEPHFVTEETLQDKHQYILDILLEQEAIDWVAYRTSQGGVMVKKMSSLYPDADYQLSQIFKSSRSGDFILSAKKGFDLREKFEIPEHRSSHGSLIAEHMYVPLCLNKRVFQDLERTMDVFPLIKENILNSDTL